MDRSYGDGAFAGNQTAPIAERASYESVHSQRLQKKRSVHHGPRGERLLPVDQSVPPALSTADRRGSRPSTTGADVGPGRRTGSLRTAVRKLFGRRSKDVDSPSQPSSVSTTPLRHQYHRSEPVGLPAPAELPEHHDRFEEPKRIISAPLQTNVSPGLSRLRSPNAVEFPKSKQLKPLTLRAPFDDPRGTLRRRKTLPSLLVSERDAAQLSTSIASADPPPMPSSFEAIRQAPVPGVGSATSTSRKAKRRSRSAGDLQSAVPAAPPRKRSDEIRWWRESMHGSVLRASGFTANRPGPPSDVALTPPKKLAEALDARRESVRNTLSSSPPFELRSASGFGTEYSRDLEDRVAKLEANLQAFQQSLRRIQTEKSSRRAGFVGEPDYPRLPDELRTPSMLADDLHKPLTPSHYQYGYEPAARPSTAPHRQEPERQTDLSEADPPPLPVGRGVGDLAVLPPLSTLAPTARPSEGTGNGDGNGNDGDNNDHNNSKDKGKAKGSSVRGTENVAYRSLYQMLSDERSARRRLEFQLRDLRTDMSDLQYQVQSQSQIQSQRSSYLYPLDTTAGSSRLRELLGDPDIDSPRPDQPRGSALTETVVSRFSGSTRRESEAGAAPPPAEQQQQQQRAADSAESETTPYENYQTLSEERAAFPLPPSHSRRPEGMF